jgi:acyl-CoA synthetase (NDP forming)
MGDADAEKFKNALGVVSADENVGATVMQPLERFKKHGITNYFDPVRAVKALCAVDKYRESREKVSAPPPYSKVDRKAIEKLIELRERKEAKMGIGVEGFKVLEAYSVRSLWNTHAFVR